MNSRTQNQLRTQGFRSESILDFGFHRSCGLWVHFATEIVSVGGQVGGNRLSRPLRLGFEASLFGSVWLGSHG